VCPFPVASEREVPLVSLKFQYPTRLA